MKVATFLLAFAVALSARAGAEPKVVAQRRGRFFTSLARPPFSTSSVVNYYTDYYTLLGGCGISVVFDFGMWYHVGVSRLGGSLMKPCA